jgi:hypothetical protein
VLVHRRTEAAQLLGDGRVPVRSFVDGDENHALHGDLRVAAGCRAASVVSSDHYEKWPSHCEM